MRIGIEAQRIFRPNKHGMDRVVLELIKNLQELDKVNEYFIFVKPGQDNSVIQETSNFKIIEITGAFYPWWEQVKLQKTAKFYKCDILHCTSNTAPYFKKLPLITTLHDIIFSEEKVLKVLTGKASWYQKFGNLYRRIIVSKVVKNSNVLLTVSNFEKNNISHFFQLNHKKIQTVYNGVSENFTTNFNPEQLEEVIQKYKLPKEYIFHIANCDPRKNTKRVLMAFDEFTKKTNGSHKLVLLGYKENDLRVMLQEIDATFLLEHISLLGYVPDNDLPAIYYLSKLFLFPSLREGFGIPVIEAMACGVPVITSNVSSMPEVAGNAAHLIHPENVEELYNAMIKITSDATYKNQLIEKGLLQSKKFSWQNTAKQVLEQYKKLNKEINL